MKRRIRYLCMVPLYLGCLLPRPTTGRYDTGPWTDTAGNPLDVATWLADCGAPNEVDARAGMPDAAEPFVGTFEGRIEIEETGEGAPLHLGIVPKAYERATELPGAWRVTVWVLMSAEPWLLQEQTTGRLCLADGQARLVLDPVPYEDWNGTLEPPWDPTTEATSFSVRADGTAHEWDGTLELVTSAEGEDARERVLWARWGVAR